MKKNIFIGLCVFFLGISGITYAADTKVILDSSDSTSGFSIKDSANQTIMRAGGVGNVGIGTTSPGNKLHIVGDNDILRLQSASAGSFYEGIVFYDNSGTRNAGIRAHTSVPQGSQDNLEIWSQSGDIYFSSGNVGIGKTDTSGYKLWVQGASGQTNLLNLFTPNDSGVNLTFYYNDLNNQYVIRSTAAAGLKVDSNLYVSGSVSGTAWINLSSREYKENIKKVGTAIHTEMLNQLMKLDLTTYNYKKEFGGDNTTKLGFIAEEMPKEVLSKDGKGVDVYELLTFTIGAMKAQQKENESLKQDIAEIKEALGL